MAQETKNTFLYGIQLWLGTIVIIIVVGVVAWWAGQKPLTIQGVSGIQGIVTSADHDERAFTIERTAFVRGDSEQKLLFKEDAFTVLWNDKTKFLTYEGPSAIKQDAVISVQQEMLQESAEVVVTPRERAGNVITAVEIRILP